MNYAEVIYHDRLLEKIKAQMPEWDESPDFVVLEDTESDLTNNPALYRREQLMVEVDGNTPFMVSFPSIRDLFRETSFSLDDDDESLWNSFKSSVDQSLISAVDHFGVSCPSDNDLMEIFSAMRRRPDGRSLGLAHNLVWKGAMRFLLEYECDQKAYEAFFQLLEHEAKIFRNGYNSYIYIEFSRSLLNGELTPDYDPDVEFDEDQPEECLCPKCRTQMNLPPG